MTVIVYRSKSASFAANRVAKAVPGIKAVQQDSTIPADARAVVRWDCWADGLSLPQGAIDINPAIAVQRARDKAETRRLLAELAPPTWFARPDIQVPCVIRPKTHKAGARFHVVRETSGVLRAVRRCGNGWYASRLIEKAREFRVFVVQGRVVAVSERFPAHATDVAWNLARGGRLINLERKAWPTDILRAALEAARRLGLGFGAVDACFCTEGRAWIFEANTSPALRNKFTIKQIAKGLAACGTMVIPPIKDGAQKAKSFAHPAIVGER